MKDWRDSYPNCYDCAEFQDNEQETELCKKCMCFNCHFDRDECLRSQWCNREKMEIEILTKLL